MCVKPEIPFMKEVKFYMVTSCTVKNPHAINYFPSVLSSYNFTETSCPMQF